MTHPTIHYSPEYPPEDNPTSEWTRRELEKIVEILEPPDVPIAYAAPTKPRDGQLLRADGTSWDPGSGRGIYVFDEDLWKLVIAL